MTVGVLRYFPSTLKVLCKVVDEGGIGSGRLRGGE